MPVSPQHCQSAKFRLVKGKHTKSALFADPVQMMRKKGGRPQPQQPLPLPPLNAILLNFCGVRAVNHLLHQL